MRMRPLVSIGLPVRNGATLLRGAIESLLGQDYSALEIIISDNASTDQTSDICREYASKDPRIRYSRNDRDIGPVENLNRVLALSNSPYFMWASHDDEWKPSYVRKCIELLERHPDTVLAAAQCVSQDSQSGKVMFTDPGLTTIGLRPAARFRRYRAAIHSGQHVGGIFYGVYRSAFLARAMPIRNIIATDHLVLAQLCLLGEFATVAEPLLLKRYGGISRSFKSIAMGLGLRNPLLTRFPYLVREAHMQQLIFQSGQLTTFEKACLSCWSASHYLWVNFLVGGAKNLVPEFIKEPVKRWLRRCESS